ncbi:MAG: alpha/beta hydrolase-fold protein [Bacteroidota bacterium]
MTRTTVWLGLLACLPGLASGQAVDTTDFGAITYQIALANSADNEYVLYVTTPPGYEQGQRYPVVYYLDAWWLRDVVRGAYGMARVAEKAEAVLLVGISVPGDEDAWHRHRNADFTPTPFRPLAPGLTMNIGTVPIDSASTGRSALFSRFLERTVFPLVEAEYGASRSDRGLIGHSLGGLFGLWAIQARPDLFRRVAMIAPSGWWNKGEWIGEALRDRLDQNDVLQAVFLGVGGAEQSLILRPAATLDERLIPYARAELRYQYKTYPEADHTAVVAPAVYDSIVWLYGTD